ncbi:MAG: hypothetical protein ABW089_09850 [Sedimenticola sp.]
MKKLVGAIALSVMSFNAQAVILTGEMTGYIFGGTDRATFGTFIDGSTAADNGGNTSKSVTGKTLITTVTIDTDKAPADAAFWSPNEGIYISANPTNDWLSITYSIDGFVFGDRNTERYSLYTDDFSEVNYTNVSAPARDRAYYRDRLSTGGYTYDESQTIIREDVISYESYFYMYDSLLNMLTSEDLNQAVNFTNSNPNTSTSPDNNYGWFSIYDYSYDHLSGKFTRGTNISGGYYINSFTLREVPVPAPAPLALLSLGLAAISFTSRKAK